ncbi:Protein RMD5 -like protein A [Babesia sp. Xinjiang]|uniref:Protein RMD5 -like protein A n=1 Tax=Babesia sp. Xinjiang TaxID=462227 RepID=UPI000A24F17F|nr:Protein RMD5 -like protein A [Babesia sp. Xinjiang]ORM39585.1 Protein RMD5 -like protein A [Babesia sp. Xinjiang]
MRMFESLCTLALFTEYFAQESTKRSYQDAMGCLIQDAVSLRKRQKLLFSKLYSHIQTLVNLVEETATSLTATSTQAQSSDSLNLSCSSALSNHGALDNTPNGISEKPAEPKQSEVRLDIVVPPEVIEDKNGHNEPDIALQEKLTALAAEVRALDAHRHGMINYREFKSHYVNLGAELFKSGEVKDIDLLPRISFDEQLIVQMIGMHLLHYGLFDVYYELEAEIIKRWGLDCRALVSGAVFSAYKMLHKLLARLRNNDIQSLIDWATKQRTESHIHEGRFNALLMNLHKVHLLGDLYVSSEGVMGVKEFQISPERILQVQKSQLSHMWESHSTDIGKLMTQALLGENLPSVSDFVQLKHATEKMFIKLFCESGVKVKKSEKNIAHLLDRNQLVVGMDGQKLRRDRKNFVRKKGKKANETGLHDEDFLFADNFIRRPLIGKPKAILPKLSWLALLEKECSASANFWSSADESKNHLFALPKCRPKTLGKGWLRSIDGCTSSPRRFPRLCFSRLQASSLSHGNHIKTVKRCIAGIFYPVHQFYHVRTICAARNDPETACRQLILQPSKSDSRSVALSRVYSSESCDATLTAGDEASGEARVRSAATAVLIAASELADDSYINISNIRQLSMLANSPYLRQQALPPRQQQQPQDDVAMDSQPDAHPTLSLTLLTGSPLLRDNTFTSFLGERDSQQRVMSAGGGRIRITFPPRIEPSDFHTSHVRRSTGRGLRIRPSDPSLAHIDSNATAALGEEIAISSGSREPANINVRGILRLIMRGIVGDSLPNADAMIQLAPDAGTELPSTGVRQDHDPPVDKKDEPVAQCPEETTKGSFKTAYERDDSGDYVRIFLPYESPISVLICAGYLLYPRLIDVVGMQRMNESISSEFGSLMRSFKQLPIESDLGPAFWFHSYLTCPISKDQTCSHNLPVMLLCGHVICSLCAANFASSRRKLQFKCPMCPQMITPGEVKKLFLDWNSCGLDDSH